MDRKEGKTEDYGLELGVMEKNKVSRAYGSNRWIWRMIRHGR